MYCITLDGTKCKVFPSIKFEIGCYKTIGTYYTTTNDEVY